MADSTDGFRYLGYIKLRWRLIATSCAIAVTLALVVTLLMPRQYTATARIVIDPPAGADIRAAMAVSPIYLESLRTYERFATAGSLFEKAVERFGLRQLVGNRPIESLQKSVLRVELVRNTRILEIAATLPDPRRAQALARFLAEDTVEMNRAVVAEGAQDLVGTVAQEERQARARSQETDAAWAHVLTSEPVDALQSDLAAAADLRSDIQQQIAGAELEIAESADRARQVQASISVSASRARLQELRRQLLALDRQEAEQQRLLAQRLADRDKLAPQRQADEAAFSAMEQRLSEARGESGYRGERLRIIEPAIVPERPSSPNLPLNLAVALLLGLALPVIYFTLEMSYQEQRAGSRRGEFRAVSENVR
ncbi:MAG: Wzz/FepE/Etk N-terminal domain-containing protein [Bryobacteraceae bacterium]